MQNGSRYAIISGSPYTASAPETLAAADAPASLPDPIDYAIPGFVLLVLAEMIVAWATDRRR